MSFNRSQNMFQMQYDSIQLPLFYCFVFLKVQFMTTLKSWFSFETTGETPSVKVCFKHYCNCRGLLLWPTTCPLQQLWIIEFNQVITSQLVFHLVTVCKSLTWLTKKWIEKYILKKSTQGHFWIAGMGLLILLVWCFCL